LDLADGVEAELFALPAQLVVPLRKLAAHRLAKLR